MCLCVTVCSLSIEHIASQFRRDCEEITVISQDDCVPAPACPEHCRNSSNPCSAAYSPRSWPHSSARLRCPPHGGHSSGSARQIGVWPGARCACGAGGGWPSGDIRQSPRRDCRENTGLVVEGQAQLADQKVPDMATITPPAATGSWCPTPA